MVHALTDQSFEEYLQANKVALVDFTATWCGPCQMLKPIVEQLATEYEGKAGVAMVDIDQNRAIASKYGIMSVPTVMIFKDGQPVEQIVGLRSKPDYAKLLDELSAA